MALRTKSLVGCHIWSILQETLRTALAMGVDRGIHVLLSDKEYEGLQPLAVAKLFQKITEMENPNLIILGKQVVTFGKY